MMQKINAELNREILITTKLSLGAAFGDLGSPNRTSYSLSSFCGTLDGSSDASNCAESDFEFTITF
jgi:hypothetical protein